MHDVARRRFLTAGAGLAAAFVLAPAGRLAAQGHPSPRARLTRS